MKKIISLILILVLSAGLLISCGGSTNGGVNGDDGENGSGDGNSSGNSTPLTDDEKMRATITGFTTAYNDGDWEEMMTYLEPATKTILESIIDIAGDFIEIDLRDVFAISVNLLGAGFGELSFIETVRNSDTEAVVTVEMSSPDSPTTPIYFIMVEKSGSWLIKDMTNEKPADEVDPDGNPIIKDPTPYDFIDGLTLVRSGELFSTYWAVINTEGETVYETAFGKEDDLYDHYWVNIGGGTGFSVKKYNDGTVVQELINSRGEVVYTLADDCDYITAYGGGYIIVYQHASTITSSTHKYGVIDTNGEWTMPMTEINYLGGIAYLGEGIFHMYGKAFIDAKNGKIINTTISVDEGKEFKDGAMYMYANEGEDTIFTDDGEWISLPRNYILYTDGSYKALANCVDEYAFGKNDDTISIVIDDRFYTVNVQDFTDDGEILNSHMLEEFTIEFARSFDFFGNDYAVLEIFGVDENKYVTLVDKEANLLFAPVCIGDYDTKVEYSNGLIICCGYREAFALSESGEVVISKDKGFMTIHTFNSGLAYAITVEGSVVFIDKTGNIVISKFYKK